MKKNKSYISHCEQYIDIKMIFRIILSDLSYSYIYISDELDYRDAVKYTVIITSILMRQE